MTNYLLKEIQELASQQIRFAPRGKKIEQSLKAEQLYNEISDSQLYSYRFVCRFITDFRSEIHQKLQFTGIALKHDLLLFAEKLYNSCNVNINEVNEKVWTLKEICKKFNVSEKTVSRQRKNGLFSRRFLFGKKKRLGFLDQSVNRFFRQHQEKIRRSGQFSRLNGKEKRLILQAAHRFSASADSPSEVIRTVARFLGRSPETVRLTLLHFNQRNPDEAVLQQRKTLDETERKNIFEQYRQGVSVHSLSEQYQRSRSNIHWIIAKQQAAQIFALPLSFIADAKPVFESVTEPVFEEIPQSRSRAKTKTAVRLSAEQESSLFRQMNEYKYRAAVLRDSLDAKRPKKSVMAQIEELFEKAAALKKEIVMSFFPLVISAAKQHLSISGSKSGGLDVLISSGSITLIQAVDTFDYRRGNRFSTYLTWAVAKGLARFVSSSERRSGGAFSADEKVLDFLPDYRSDIHEQEDAQLETERMVSQLLKSLDEREQKIIKHRFGIGGDDELTLNETGRELGVSDERVRQLEKAALEKLRNL
ncbi:MAG: sigma-70 family RNA polymerase sigma factor [Planctomycetaceae bacterium]|nr:sigma-70 family RNA polymerase sigma factor [Planctomycetaceae bacterium]